MRALALLLLLAACAPPSGPGQGPGAPTAPRSQDPFAGKRLFIEAEGGVRVEDDPYTVRPVRLDAYSIYTTLVAQDVAIAVEAAEGAPNSISNQLAAALVRRFAGELPSKEALGAAKLFLIRPIVRGPDAGGAIIVDWRIRDETGADVGAVYAARTLSGRSWADFEPIDAELIALQTAGQIIETPAVSTALAAARDLAGLEATPSPEARPESVTAPPDAPPAPRRGPPAPVSRPGSPGSS